jgi:hypothetical protein
MLRPKPADICSIRCCICFQAAQRVTARPPAIRKQLKNYEKLKALMGRWIDLATELSNLRLKRDQT